MQKKKFHSFIAVSSILFFVLTLVSPAFGQGVGGTIPPVPTLPPIPIKVFLPIADNGFVRVPPKDLVLDESDVAQGFALTSEQNAIGGPNYVTAFSEWSNGADVVSSDAYVYISSGDASIDFVDTAQFYREDGQLEEIADPGVGLASAMFKGTDAGERYLFIFVRKNVLVIVGAQNHSLSDTIALAQKIANKF